MNTAVRERTPALTVSNGRVWEPHPVADPTMTRAARAARIAWRLEHLDEWQRALEDLDHYESWYPYDAAHEYEDDWTTDPNYGPWWSVQLCEFNEDGVQHFDDDRPQAIELYMRDTARDRVGYRVTYQTRYSFVPEIAERLGLRTRQGRPANTVRPDLTVMPSEEDLDPARQPEDRLPRPDDAVPELVLEILSKSTAARDLGNKLRLYEALGVHEYLLYDLGGKRRDDSPRELLMYRLEGGAYRRVPADPGLSEPLAQAYWSEVFDAHIRMMLAEQEAGGEARRSPEGLGPVPRFQWRDAAQGRWRDRETDERYRQDREKQEAEVRGRQEGREEGRVEGMALGREAERTDMAIDLLHKLLSDRLPAQDCDHVAAHWWEHGPPMDPVDRILAVRETPNEWRSLLQVPDDESGRGP